MALNGADIYMASPANTPISFLSHTHQRAYSTIKGGAVYVTDTSSIAFTFNLKKHAVSGTSLYDSNKCTGSSTCDGGVFAFDVATALTLNI